MNPAQQEFYNVVFSLSMCDIIQGKLFKTRDGEPLKRYQVITYGCQMNESDTEKIHGVLEQLGYLEAGSTEEADLLLINTCCVRETAENKVFGLLGRLKKLKEQKPNLFIGIGGCMTQLQDTADYIKKKYPHVNLVFGTSSIHRLPDLIAESKSSKKTLIDQGRPEGIFEGVPSKRISGYKAWVPIIYGCNNFCTYCIVPFVRGRERSRNPGEIIKELQNLAEQGYKEVTLLGQNVNSYGKDFKDLKERYGFSELLLEVDRIKGLERIRFLTSHPKDFTDHLIETIKNTTKVCEHIHIPIQSGSNRILKLMNRGYNREYYLELVNKIRESIPDVSITSDIMVGFPGETEKDFFDTLDILEKVRYDTTYTFVYNKRKGTPADSMQPQVPEQEKSKWIEILIKKQNEISLERNAREMGTIHEVLVEGAHKSRSGINIGRTRTNKLVYLAGTSQQAGQVVKVKIVGYTLSHLDGEVTGQ